MSLAKVLGAFALAGLGAVGLFVFDFASQWSKAKTRFGGPQYVETLIYRFGDRGGAVGLLLRKSSIIAAARPPAPAGWQASDWSVEHDMLLFSDAQSQVLAHELKRATLGLPELHELGRIDKAAYDAYLADTSITYSGRQGVIAARFYDPAHSIAHPFWRAYERAIESHFDRIDTLIEYDVVQGITWFEAHGPVELANNAPHPNRLRSFEGQLGGTKIYLTTRAPEQHIARFLETVDLSALRSLAREDPPTLGAPKKTLPKVARASQVPTAGPTTLRVNRGLD